MYTVASPRPDPRRGGQLPYPESAILRLRLTSGTRGETLTPYLNERNSILMSGARWGRSPYKLGKG